MLGCVSQIKTVATERFNRTDSQTTTEGLAEHRQRDYIRSFGVQQEAGESVKETTMAADDTSCRQADGHLVPGLQPHSSNEGATVLQVPLFYFSEDRHRVVVDPQTGAGGHAANRGTSVEGDGEAVNT